MFFELKNGSNKLQCNVTLGWKGLPGTNTLAYYDEATITVVKSFTVETFCLPQLISTTNEDR